MRLFVIILLFSGSFISTNPQSSDPEEMILGKWHAENDSTFVWEFYENGQHFTYSDDELIRERSWEIVNECEGEAADNKEDFAMLEIGRGDSLPSQCYVVQGLNGVLTLLAIPQGRLLIFDRVKNWTDNLDTENASAHQDTVHTGLETEADTLIHEPEGMPVLKDTTDFMSLRSYLIDLNTYYRDNLDQRESIIPNFWKLCPIYFEMSRDRSERHAIAVQKAFNELPEVNTENYTFLREILAPTDTSLLAYEKPLGAVFQGVTNSPGVYGEERGGKAEKRLLERIREHPNTEVERPDIIQSITTFTFEENMDSVYVFTKTNSTKTSLRNFKFESLECLSFFHYELGDTGETVDPNDILISTPYNLDLEYYWDEELDQMISEEFQGVCLDCPDSSMYQKPFARLKGYENFYFTYTREPGKETDDTYVPKRSLIYFDGEILHTIWSTDIDLFGCSCL